MNQARKDQLKKKLAQIYEDGSGRTEGIIDDLLQETFLGHTYFINAIGETTKHPPCEDWDREDKDVTLVEFGLYQDGNACLGTFTVPVSTKVLNDLAARIDAAYFHWMQREPSSLRESDPFEYYRTLFDVTLECTWDREFDALSLKEKRDVIEDTERYAFLPPREYKAEEE